MFGNIILVQYINFQKVRTVLFSDSFIFGQKGVLKFNCPNFLTRQEKPIFCNNVKNQI